MKLKYFTAFLFLLFMSAIFGSVQTFAQTQKLTVGNLKGTNYSGCGCSSQTLAEAKNPRSEKIVFWSEDGKTAIFNISGKDTVFKLVKRGKLAARERVGSRHDDEFAANGITIKVDYLTTRMCLKNEEDCEATFYDVTITAVKGNLKTIVKTKGSCGC